VLSTAPAHHLYGLLFSLLVPAVSGGSFVRQTPLHAETIAALARALQASVLVSVPPHLHGLQALAPGSLPALKIFCSGGRLPAGVAAALRQRFGVPLTEILGSTETGGIAWRTGDADEAWTPLPGVQVSAGAEGLLLVDSPFLDPATPRPFAAADRIAPRPDGRFLHLGRADAVVKVAGERVSLAEIEQRLLAVPGVLDAAVVALEDEGPRQHELGAAVVAPGLTATDLRRALRQHLEPVAIPRRFALLPNLPREATGKLPRQTLLALFRSPSADAAEAQP
jgi:acyl-coenzyme A synthetase/AMP-(fatty) acid ligase